jgi:signal recognition particle subunit SRP54
VRAVTGKPIKFVGTSEKMDGLEPFYPDRMVSRILGMGDVLSLIEKAEAAFDEDQTRELERKMREDELDFDDYLLQLEQMRKMGPLDQVLSMIPGFGKMKQMQGVEVDESQLEHTIAIIRSMTKEERREPGILNGSRKRRIADGSGTSVQEINRLVKQFGEARKMIKSLAAADQPGKHGRGQMPPFFG